MIIDVQALADQKLLFRYLIDNALSDQAGLSDNELIAFLMTAQGFTQGEIARVLIPTNHYHDWESRDSMSSSGASELRRSALRKVRAVSGLNDIPFSSKEKSAMPRGVYDRSKSKPRPPRDGRAVPAAEETSPPSDPAWRDQPWGQPYPVDPHDMLLEVFCDEAEQALKSAPAVAFPFINDESAEAAVQALQERIPSIRAWARRNPPRVIVMNKETS